jgi:hypothetical protein
VCAPGGCGVHCAESSSAQSAIARREPEHSLPSLRMFFERRAIRSELARHTAHDRAIFPRQLPRERNSAAFVCSAQRR